jgi:ketosteroid isomerase-like protein
MRKELPPPLQSYFDAKNRQDIDGMLAPFAADATVRDERRTHIGHAAIRAWMEETTRKYRDTAAVSDVTAEGDGICVAAIVSGDFPGSPVTLRFVFTLEDGRIRRLEIGA